MPRAPLRIPRVIADPDGASAALDERLLLRVDGGGALLLCTAARLSLGHRSAAVDLPFLADVGAPHAWLEHAESLRDGPCWRLLPVAGEPTWCNGEALAEPRALSHGDRLRLGANLALDVRRPAPGSASVLLVLAGGECLGAARICLWRPGAGGRLSVGPHGRAHVPTPDAPGELTLELRRERIVLACGAGLCAGSGAPRSEHDLARPLRAPAALSAPPPAPGRPPFALSLAPVAGARRDPARGGG